MGYKKFPEAIFPFLLALLLTLLIFTSQIYTQQEERTQQPQLTRDQSLFPLQSTGIWTEVHPLIPRVDYWGLDFVNADTGWTVGEGGAIIKTTNGGQNWIWYESGLENTLRTVSAVNNGQRVIAAGDGGIILISEDAGETWNILPSGTNDNIWNMQMITNEIGWMVGEGATALKTTDGGLTWNQQSVPHTVLPYWDLSFVDTSFGYICCNSAVVLKTKNGGISWEIQQAGDTRSLFTIYAFDTLKASAGGFAGKVVYTTNGGINWLYASGTGVTSNKIKFIDDTLGFMAANGGFCKSTDGGISWFTIDDLYSGSDSAPTTNLTFPAGTNGYVTGYKMLLAKTANDGENWRRTIVNNDFINVYFKNEQEGFINSASLIYKTNDGGYTLDTLLTFPYNEIYSMEGMAFTDSLNGFIGTLPARIYKTTNAGQSWYRNNITGLIDSSWVIIKFFFLTNDIAWAISNKRIMKTTDGGENWFVQLNLPGAGYFSGIHFVDSLSGWASILGRRPYKTIDSGNNWIEEINLNLYSTTDIYFRDDSIGLIIDNDKLYKTFDGGYNWFLDSSVAGLWQGRFDYFDSDNIFITGTKVYRTTNAGINWTEFPELEGQGWREAITLITVNSGYFVASTGLIVKYYDESVPVELINFEGWLNENEIYLQWATATETNNRGFYIQRKKLSEQDWIDLDFLEGKGNSTEINYYSYKDILNESGVYCYRLKQTDFDGTFNFSKEIEICFSVPLEFELFQNFPNPFNSFTIIKYSLAEKSFVDISLYDVRGEKVSELVNEEKERGKYSIKFKSDKLATGVYLYRISTSSGYNATKKLILLK